MLLDDVVARACRDVIAVRPDSGPRIIRKQWALECITMIGAERIGPGANGVTHVERTLRVTRRPPEDWQHVQPSIRQLVITHHRVPAGLRLTLASEPFEDRIG